MFKLKIQQKLEEYLDVSVGDYKKVNLADCKASC
jgi:hypothetical protein